MARGWPILFSFTFSGTTYTRAPAPDARNALASDDAMAKALANTCGKGVAEEKKFSEIPKAVIELQRKLPRDHATPEKLRQLGAKQYDALSNNFRNRLNSAQEAELKTLTTEGKSNWLSQWAIDPEAGRNKGFSKGFVFTEESLDEEDRWVTREQLVEFHKSGGNATILIEAKELPDRPSRYEAFEILDKGIE